MAQQCTELTYKSKDGLSGYETPPRHTQHRFEGPPEQFLVVLSEPFFTTCGSLQLVQIVEGVDGDAE